MVVYGIASEISQDVADFYNSPDEAEAALAEVVADAPELEPFLWIERVEFANRLQSWEPAVTPTPPIAMSAVVAGTI